MFGVDPVYGPRPMQVLGLLELTPFVVHGLCKFSGCDSLVGEGSGRQAAQGVDRRRSVTPFTGRLKLLK